MSIEMLGVAVFAVLILTCFCVGDANSSRNRWVLSLGMLLSIALGVVGLATFYAIGIPILNISFSRLTASRFREGSLLIVLMHSFLPVIELGLGIAFYRTFAGRYRRVTNPGLP